MLDVGSGIGGPSRFLASRYGCEVTGIETTGGVATGVTTADGSVPAGVVLVATDVYRLPGLLGAATPPALRARIDGYALGATVPRRPRDTSIGPLSPARSTYVIRPVQASRNRRSACW